MIEAQNLEYTIQIWREGNQIVAHAMPLDVMSCGETQEDAINALEEAVSLFLQVAEEKGTLADVLEEAGYTYLDGQWSCPPWIGIERHLVGA